MSQRSRAPRLGLALLALGGFASVAASAPDAAAPDELWTWGSTWDTSLAIPLEADFGGLGGKASAGLFVSGLPDPWSRIGLDGGFRYLARGEGDSLALPQLGLNWSYNFLLAGFLNLNPGLGLDLGWNVRPTASSAFLAARLSLRAEVLLADRNYLGVTVEGAIPFSAELPPVISLGLSLRKAWALPVSASQAAAAGSRMSPSLNHSPTLFSPDGDGVDDILRFRLAGPRNFLAVSWELQILDPTGQIFWTRRGQGAPPAALDWDGRGGNGELLESAMDYQCSLTLADAAGQRWLARDLVNTDVLVMPDGDRLRIRLPNIQFPADSVELVRINTDAFLANNHKVLARLVEIFQRFPSYSLTIEGHANATHWQDAKLAQKEQAGELLPISLNRAKAVKDALVSLGIAENRISVVGKGGENPLVPFSDEKNSWKNRRVEILLRR